MAPDPGRTRLRVATRAVLGIAVAVAVCGLAGHSLTGAGTGGLAALLALFTVSDATVRGQAVTTALLPVVGLPVLTAAAGLHDHPVARYLAFLAVVGRACSASRGPARAQPRRLRLLLLGDGDQAGHFRPRAVHTGPACGRRAVSAPPSCGSPGESRAPSVPWLGRVPLYQRPPRGVARAAGRSPPPGCAAAMPGPLSGHWCFVLVRRAARPEARGRVSGRAAEPYGGIPTAPWHSPGRRW